MTEQAGSYDEFYLAHRDKLVRALTRVTRCPLEAEEVAHEAFVSLWCRWDRLGHVEDLEAYLYRTAMNAFRKRCRRPAIEQSASDGGGADPLLAAETRQLVGAALAGLAPQQHRAVMLVDLLGFTASEAGELLGLQASTVRVHLTRARRHLRTALVATAS